MKDIKPPKKKKPSVVDIASDDSFPCSDPPGWITVHADAEEAKEKVAEDKKKS